LTALCLHELQSELNPNHHCRLRLCYRPHSNIQPDTSNHRSQTTESQSQSNPLVLRSRSFHVRHDPPARSSHPPCIITLLIAVIISQLLSNSPSPVMYTRSKPLSSSLNTRSPLNDHQPTHPPLENRVESSTLGSLYIPIPAFFLLLFFRRVFFWSSVRCIGFFLSYCVKSAIVISLPPFPLSDIDFSTHVFIHHTFPHIRLAIHRTYIQSPIVIHSTPFYCSVAL